jgi:gas vesicle protein
MERDNVFSCLSAFAIGSLAGAAFALLYAPASGDETRRVMRDRIRRGTDLGREKLREGASYTREKLQEGAEYGRQVAQRVTGKAQELADEATAFAEAQGVDVSAFGERRRKPRTVSPEMPEPV